MIAASRSNRTPRTRTRVHRVRKQRLLEEELDREIELASTFGPEDFGGSDYEDPLDEWRDA